MTRAVLVSATLAALAVHAAEVAPAPAGALVRSGPQPIQYAGADLAQVAAVRFFASNNGGGAWTRIGEAAVDAAHPVAPRVEFRAPSDGTWHFLTAATLRDGRSEPDPKPGVLPANALSVVIDNTPPEIQEVQATVDALGAGTATVGVTWKASDANFAGISVEVSGDGGRSFVAAPATTPTGYLKLTVGRTPGVQALVVRVGAKDLAGNAVTAPPRTLPLPAPADPEQALAQAVAGLPDPADIAPVAAEPPVAAAAATEPAPPAANTAAAVDEAPAAAPAPAEAGPAVAASPVEAGPDTYLEPTASPAARAKGDLQPRVPVAPYRESPASGPAPVPPPGTFLVGASAGALLAEARDLAAAGQPAAAIERYRRLLDSDRAVEAAAEGMALLNRGGDHAAAAAIGDGLAIELRSDAVRIEHARSLLALGRDDQALQALAPISGQSERAREAMLLVADVRAAQGRGDQARRIYTHLGLGEDLVAREARRRLAQ